MGTEEHARLRDIELHLREISGKLGGIQQFMETSVKQTNELFERQRRLEINGCANMPDHKKLIEKVDEHDRVLNKAVGAMIATGAIGSFLGTVGGWVLSSWHGK
jgi:hypothetical protein